MKILQELFAEAILSEQEKDNFEKEIASTQKTEEELILEKKLITEDKLFEIKSKILNLPFRKVKPEDVLQEVLEIMPEEAHASGAAVVATGRPDYPNQVNNVLVFPGVFRGALENKVSKITDEMKIRAAKALAKLVMQPSAKKIIPTVFDRRVAKAVANAIR